jgi:hypothetical protein
METFDLIIEQITFTFIRVTYGRGDLWYHASFKKEDSVLTFRMSTDENSNWTVFDTSEKSLFDMQFQFSEAIKDFEAELHPTHENIGQKIKVAS